MLLTDGPTGPVDGKRHDVCKVDRTVLSTGLSRFVDFYETYCMFAFTP